MGGPGPDLRKTREQSLVYSRSRELIRYDDYRWPELFESADIMSEGALVSDSTDPVYFGTSSILLRTRSAGGKLRDEELVFARAKAERDPHARVRAIRIACREAQVRSPLPLIQVRAELVFVVDPAGMRMTVELEAPAMAQASRGGAPMKPPATFIRTATASKMLNTQLAHGRIAVGAPGHRSSLVSRALSRSLGSVLTSKATREIGARSN